ncbi:hypothetical protein I4641_14155 [Waterburya agarophytonicola K14]|uniref:Calcium-binding protein n=1 Tax=Waterburya agarophytonicola KI4 TaxID=2874699 RepID=A0A964FI36_9CYAN|nr:hypothetical protein [Waterburya agarophytonicola]MCC0178124.1 hypothetical protein [Waterburya agarophytonicola KI4]
MTINFTEVGWTDENGNLLGTWTNQSDFVNDETAINVPQGLTVNTLNGNDLINCNSESQGILIDDDAQLNTGNGNDTINSSGFIAIDLGFNAQLNTGNGNDNLVGQGFDGFFLRVSSTINTGNGNDNIFGTGLAVGVGSRGTIIMGKGDDIISGIATNPADNFFGSTGVANFLGTIDTGEGNDIIFAKSNNVAISNRSGTINMGKGNDIIDALTGGFADFDGSGRISLGQGNDLIRGFGDHRGNVDGGHGYDRAELGFDYDENLITFGSTNSTSIDITFDSATMSFSNIEAFNFNGQEFSLAQLQNEV